MMILRNYDFGFVCNSVLPAFFGVPTILLPLPMLRSISWNLYESWLLSPPKNGQLPKGDVFFQKKKLHWQLTIRMSKIINKSMEFPGSLPDHLSWGNQKQLLNLNVLIVFWTNILHPLVFFKIDISLATLFLAATQPIKWAPSTC